MTSWPEERARLLASRRSKYLPNPRPASIGSPIEHAEDVKNDVSGCCTESRPCVDHFDDVFLSWLDGQVERRFGAS